jgi:hypothetical protein
LESFYSSFSIGRFVEVTHNHQRTFLRITQGFTALTSTNFSPPSSPVQDQAGSELLWFKKRVSQREAKRARAKELSPAADDTPFQTLGFCRPTSKSDYDAMIDEVMEELKAILRVRNGHDRTIFAQYVV